MYSATKKLVYDARSLNPHLGDEVEVVIQHFQQEPEIFKATYLGCVQLESYTTPYVKFMVNTSVRMVNSNSIREIRFNVQAPKVEPELLED